MLSCFYFALVVGKLSKDSEGEDLGLATCIDQFHFWSRCCNTCDDVREAYRRRGWAFKNADTIEQCKREGFTQKMQEQKNEGCQVYGFLEVNKVGTPPVDYEYNFRAKLF